MQGFSLRQMILDHQMSIMQREMKLTLNNGMLFQTVAGLFQIVALQNWLERAINRVLTFPTFTPDFFKEKIMFHFISSLVTWDVVILVLIIFKHMFGYGTFNVKYYILSL